MPRFLKLLFWLLLLAIFLVDLFVPDPSPWVDEILLGLLTWMTRGWRHWRSPDGGPSEKPPEKNVTPPASRT